MCDEFDLNIVADVKVFEQNRLKPVAYLDSYANFNEFLAQKSSYKKCLNGKWRFKFAKNFADFDQSFYKSDYDYSHFDYINVPAHFQTQGFGKIQYTNISYPWEGYEKVKTGLIPKKYNPVGSYITYFQLPDNFNETFICFDGADSALALWVNGHYVGYSEDSATPSVFDISKYVKKGQDNKLAVAVFTYSSGSLLEDQDYFRLSGLSKDVYIFTKAPCHVEDLFVNTYLSDNYTKAKIDIQIEFNNQDSMVLYQLFDPNDKLVFEKKQSSSIGNVSIQLDDIYLWSAEKPNLYHLCIRTYDHNNQECYFTKEQVGIREFKIIDNIMCLNGKRIVFNGVNRHEFFPKTGRVLPSYEALVKDLQIIKDLNINAIRTSHYPNNVLFYKLCNQMGFYVINEMNLETHGTWQALGKVLKDNDDIIPNDNQLYLKPVLARAVAMLERDKNNPCILINSCGNESYGGSVIHEVSEYFRQRDKNRLVHYEGIFHDRRYNDTSDMESQMYPSVKSIEQFLANNTNKPFICCEYTHAMGTSCGGMKKYTDLSHTNKFYQGGFIWDFADQAMYKRETNGVEYLGYGGDFDDRPCDYNFSGNGIVFADRSLTPKAMEVFYNYQNFKIELFNDSFSIENYHLFTNLNEFDLKLSVLINGVVKKIFDLQKFDLKPGDKKIFALDDRICNLVKDIDEEYSFILRVYKDTKLVAYEQGIFNQYKPRVNTSGKISLVEGFSNYGVYINDSHFLFSKALGTLTSIVHEGQEILKEPVAYSFFRAPTDNDRGNFMAQRLSKWLIAARYCKCVAYECHSDKDRVEIKFTHLLGGCTNSFIYTRYIFENGHLKLELEYKKSDELPEYMVDFSMLFSLNGSFEFIKSYTNGPMECYVDRDNGALSQEYDFNVFEQMVANLKPQECGNHTQTRYVTMSNDKNVKIRFEKDQDNFNFSALAYSPYQLENALHMHELQFNNRIYLKISKFHMGIGGDDSWGALPLEEYMYKNQDVKFSFNILLD